MGGIRRRKRDKGSDEGVRGSVVSGLRGSVRRSIKTRDGGRRIKGSVELQTIDARKKRKQSIKVFNESRINNTKRVFDYASFYRPDTLPSTLHFRTVLLFKSMDLACTGLAAFAQLNLNVDSYLKRDLGQAGIKELKKELKLEQKRIKRELFHITEFSAVLIRIKARHSNAKTNMRAGIKAPSKMLLEEGRAKTVLGEDLGTNDWQSMGPWARRRMDFKLKFTKLFNARRFSFFPKGITKIESKFGGELGAYFDYFQLMFWLNFIMAMMNLAILIPGWAYPPIYKEALAVTDYAGVVIGEGLHDTWMFYGGYLPEYDGYRVDLVWLVVSTICLLVSLIVLIRSMGPDTSGSTDNISTTSTSHRPLFVQTLFTFDHKIRSPNYIQLQRNRVETNLRLYIQEGKEQRAFVSGHFSMLDKTKRFLGWFFYFIFCGASGFAVIFAMSQEANIINTMSGNPSLAAASTLAVPSLISLLKAASPKFVDFVTAFEPYKRSTDRFRVTFIRIFFVRMFYILVVYFQLTENAARTEAQNDICEETLIGVQYYRMLWVEFFFEVLFSTLFPFTVIKIKQCLNMTKSDEECAKSDPGLLFMSKADRIKPEFTVPDALVDIMYQQALVWSGLCFCPALPYLAAFVCFWLIAVKQFQVRTLTRPPLKPIGLRKQATFFRSMMLCTLVVSCVPFALFLRREMTCGPHEKKEPGNVFVDWMNTFPTFVGFTATLTQSVLLLWSLVGMMLMYVVFLMKKQRALNEELLNVQRRVKIEISEKQAIIKENRINLDNDKERGRNLFKAWMASLGEIGNRYSKLFQTAHFGDLISLASLDNHEVELLMKSWAKPEFDVSPSHISFIQNELDQKRLDLIKL